MGMSLNRAAKIILGVFSVPFLAWVLASAYFTVVGCDLPEVDSCESLPEPQNLSPDENAYTAIREYTDNLPSNSTPFHLNYKLRRAYLDGTTNRLALADSATAFITAESNTFAVAERILAARGIEVPFDEMLSACARFCVLMRIALAYRVKATREAAQGNLAAGRRSLMDAYKVGRFLQIHDSLSLELSRVIGQSICSIALYSAESALFAPDEDEEWRASLRKLHLALLDGDVELTKTAARRGYSGCVRAVVDNYATNTAARGRLISGGRNLWDVVMEGAVKGGVMDRSNDIEARFLAALATACPGYARYSFQPNRTLSACRAGLDDFCRRIDVNVYDSKYANESDRIVAGRFSRNWLATRIPPVGGMRGAYRSFFRMRLDAYAKTAVLACRSYKVKYGKCPESLSALVPEFLPEVPRDPYDGKELRYNAKDCFIWTRGEKLAFDGDVTALYGNHPYLMSYSDRRCVFFIEEAKCGHSRRK